MKEENVLEELTLKKPLFGGTIDIVVYTPETLAAEEILEDAYDEALRLQKIFNLYDPKSELSMLNNKRRMNVSDELAHVIKNALKMSEMTNGMYDVSLGRHILERKKGIDASKGNASYKDVKVEGNFVELINESVVIDLGSIAKGYITDKIGEFLQARGINDFFIDSRGDMLAKGNVRQIVGVQHPRDEDEEICEIEMQDIAVATSGDYNQFYGSYGNSHIINAKDVASVTVAAETLEEADAYATALFVIGKDERKALMEKSGKVRALVIDKDLNKEMHNRFEELMHGN